MPCDLQEQWGNGNSVLFEHVNTTVYWHRNNKLGLHGWTHRIGQLVCWLVKMKVSKVLMYKWRVRVKKYFEMIQLVPVNDGSFRFIEPFGSLLLILKQTQQTLLEMES